MSEGLKADKYLYDYVKELKEVKAELKVLKEKEAKMVSVIKAFMGDAEKLYYGRKCIALYIARTQYEFDTIKFKKEHPKYYQKYIKQLDDRRCLLIK